MGADVADVLFEFIIPEAVYEIREEFVVYDASALLADCAGMAGILLGFSMIAIYDILCEALGAMCSMRHKVNKLVDL